MAAGLDELVSQQSFIQATEVWVPDADGARLVPGGGFYGAHRGFAGLSAGQGFDDDGGGAVRWQVRDTRFDGGAFFLDGEALCRALFGRFGD